MAPKKDTAKKAPAKGSGDSKGGLSALKLKLKASKNANTSPNKKNNAHSAIKLMTIGTQHDEAKAVGFYIERISR